MRKYLEEVFCKRSFLEYETYSYLISNHVPALPRLRIRLDLPDMYSCVGVSGEGEIDVLAAAKDQLHVIEVTTERYGEELKYKLEKLERIRTVLNAGESILLSTEENCVRLDTSSHNVECISFKNLHEYVQKLTKKTT